MSGSNAFKPVAPVLPGLGVHSFHNDSPPFAAAAKPDEPDHLALESLSSSSSSIHPRGHPGAGPRQHSTLSHSGIPTSSHSPQGGSASGPSPMPIPSGGRPSGQMQSSSYLRNSDEKALPSLPLAAGGHGGTGTEHDADVALSRSRSRSLVSGYLFGQPPSEGEPTPSVTRTVSEHGGDDNDRAGADIPTPPRPQSPELRNAPLPPQSKVTDEQVSKAMQGITVTEHPELGAAAGSRGKSRADSKARGPEGYEALLNGLNDGEADLDESAPRAEWGTEAFVKGLGGEAGEYKFPRHRLRTTMKDESKIPLVIVACGSFSPPTYLHLRMFEMAKDEILESQTYEIMAGYYSPVSSHYKKQGLAPAEHRVRMCELAVEHTSTWLMVDPWEAGQPEYQRTAVVLDHFDEELNGVLGGLTMKNGKKRKYKVMLLAGGDLIESFGEPGVWSEPDLHIILGRFGCLIVERTGSDVWAFLLSHDILYHHRRNVIVIKQLIYNDISSTKVRLFVRRGMSIKYLLPNSVIQYIYDNKLYRDTDAKAIKH